MVRLLKAWGAGCGTNGQFGLVHPPQMEWHIRTSGYARRKFAIVWGDRLAVTIAACAVSGTNSMISQAARAIVGRTIRCRSAAGREARCYLPTGRSRSRA